MLIIEYVFLKFPFEGKGIRRLHGARY